MKLLSDLELAAGFAIGVDPDVPPLRALADGPDPRTALSHAMEPALRRPPCRVSFSGGFDSSLVLAMAADTARRLDLEPPIAVTCRFPELEPAREDDWQRLVVEHLGLGDRWVQISLTDELDLVGPYATEAMDAAGGVLWPWNTHFLLPLARAGGEGGSLLTGIGGDELFLIPPWTRLLYVLEGRRRVRLRDLPVLPIPFMPPAIRSVVRWTQERQNLPWLTRAANRRLAWQWARHDGSQPLGWDRVLLESLWRSRYIQVSRRSTLRLGEGVGVEIIHPFEDPAVLQALARVGGRGGPSSRADGFMKMGGDLLPPRLLERQSKASFSEALWTERSRAFARQALPHLPPEVAGLVEKAKLAEVWQAVPPHSGTAALLQAAWYRSRHRD